MTALQVLWFCPACTMNIYIGISSCMYDGLDGQGNIEKFIAACSICFAFSCNTSMHTLQISQLLVH